MHNEELEVGDLILSPNIGLYLVIEVRVNTRSCIRIKYLSSALTGLGNANIAEIWFTPSQALSQGDILYKAAKV